MSAIVGRLYERIGPRQLVTAGDCSTPPGAGIQAISADADYAKGTPLDTSSPAIGRLSALLQAVPSIALANEVAGKRFMEAYRAIQGAEL